MAKFGWKRLLAALLVVIALSTAVMPAFAVGRSGTLAKKGAAYYVTCSKLNVRDNPSMSSNVIKMLKRGTKVTFVQMVDGWWEVKYTGGSGWVDKQYLTPTSVPKTGTYTTTARVNVRANPRVTAKRIGWLGKGAKVTLVALNGDWARISYKGRTGWIAVKYLKK